MFPIGTPVQWCSMMHVTVKKNGSPRLVVYFQKLNIQCLRATRHCPSPFNSAFEVSATKTTAFDATLDEPSRQLTMFVTEWGRYMYRRLPHGHLAA